jgi:hypothetical protein
MECERSEERRGVARMESSRKKRSKEKGSKGTYFVLIMP